MSFGQLAQLGGGESLLLAGRRRGCPPGSRHHPQRTAHVLGHPISLGHYFATHPSSSWRSVTVLAAASAAGARPASNARGPPPPEQPPPAHGLLGTLPYNEDEYVEVGRVVGAHGVRGDLRLELSTDQPNKRFRAGRRLFLLPPSAQGLAAARANLEALPLIAVTCRGAKARPLGKGEEAWMVGVEEVTDRSQAEALRGHVVLCAAADRDTLRDPDEFYVTDIIGCTVIDQASRVMLGQVVDVFSGMGTHDTLRVKLRASEEDIQESWIRYVMIPFARAICPVLDLARRVLEVLPPEGLLDLATRELLKKPLSDAAKAQKLAQLREALARERESLAAQKQEQQGGEAAATAADKEGREEEEGGDEEGEEGEGDSGGARPRRRPGLRRRPGSLRLGRRRE